MEIKVRRMTRRVVVVAAVVLLAPVIPMPGFTTEVVAAVERVPLSQWRAMEDPRGAASQGTDHVDGADGAHVDGADGEHVDGADGAHVDGADGEHEADAPGEHVDGTSEVVREGGDRLVADATDVDDFSMIGVSLQEPPTEAVLVRVRQTDGGWGEWQELDLEVEEGPDLSSPEAERAVISTEPMWVESADGYEVSLGHEDAPGADVMVVREHERTVVAETATAGASLPPLQGMHSRSEWGARAPKSTPSIAPSVKLAVVHHSVSSNSYSPGQVPGVLRGIQAYHMDGRGWDDIGYNFVVDRYGGMWEGRGGGATKPVVGAHASGFNTGSVGVMVLGDFSLAHPTSASIQAVGTVVGWKLALHGAEPSGSVSFVSGGGPRYPAGMTVNLPRVVGHGDVGATSCPGHVRNHLGSIRARASAVYPFIRALLSPEGAVESVVGGEGRVTINGWAVDRSAPGPVSVRVAAGPVKATTVTTLSRPDIKARYGGDGKAGFSRTLTGVPPGMQRVCATAWSSLGHDRDRRLGCTWTLIGDPTGKSPVGRFQGVSATPGQVHVSGWALDPETSVPVTTDLLVDGVVRSTVTADQWSSAVPARYRSLGRYRRFVSSAVAVPAGPHTVCMRARNQAGGVDTLVDCRIITVPAHDPGGVLEVVSSTRPGKVDITGWALDLESTKPINVLLVVNGRWYLVPADRRRNDIAADYPGYGPAHGFAATVNAPGGPAQVCAYGINVEGGSNKLIGCRRVDVVK